MVSGIYVDHDVQLSSPTALHASSKGHGLLRDRMPSSWSESLQVRCGGVCWVGLWSLSLPVDTGGEVWDGLGWVDLSPVELR